MPADADAGLCYVCLYWWIAMVTPACVVLLPMVTITGTDAPVVVPTGTTTFICSRPRIDPTIGPA